MPITVNSLPIKSYGYPVVEWDALRDFWNVKPPDSLVEPADGWGTLRIDIGAYWTVDADTDTVSQQGTPTDYTVFRDVPTMIESLDFGEPYGETTGSLHIPGLSIFDDLSVFNLAAVDIWRVLPAWQAATYDRLEVPYWHGFVQSVEVGEGKGNKPGVRLQLLGAMFGEISLRAHQPMMVNDSVDCGTWLGRALDPQAYSRPFSPFHFQFDTTTTGINLRHRGSRGQMVVDYCDEVLALAQTGSTAWTISRAYDANGFPRARCYYLREKSEELAGAVQQNYVVAGGFGVAASLSMDPTEVPNVIYGEGLAPSGERWRNAVYPMLTTAAPADPSSYPVEFGSVDGDFTADVVTQLQGQLRAGGWPDVQITGEFDAETTTALEALQEAAGVTVTGTIEDAGDWALVWQHGTGDGYDTTLRSGFFKPLASLTEVEKYLYAADGDVLDDNDDYDPASIRVEQQIAFGDNVSKSRAMKYAKRRINQVSFLPQYVGTITLTSDPTNEGGEARSRMDIHEGSWLRLGNARSGDEFYTDFYIAGVQPQPENYAAPVTLTVATRAWDLLDVSTRIARNRDARDNPAKSFYSMRTRPQRPWRDAAGWDAESGAGLIRDFEHPGGAWVVVPFVAGGYAGTIQVIDLIAGTDTEMAFAIFAKDGDGSDDLETVLTALIPDPLAEDTDGYGWFRHPDNLSTLKDCLLVEAWGDYDSPAGYYPGSKAAETPVTGRTLDELGWNFVTDHSTSAFLYLAVWCVDEVSAADGYVRGNMRILVTE